MTIPLIGIPLRGRVWSDRHVGYFFGKPGLYWCANLSIMIVRLDITGKAFSGFLFRYHITQGGWGPANR
jgi:hypothetical protein